MKKFVYFILIIFSCSLGINQNKLEAATTTYKQGCGATASSYGAVGLSMVGWGVAMAAAIIIICLVVKTSHAH